MVLDIGEADSKACVLLRERSSRPCDVFRHISPQAACIDKLDLHSGGIKCFSGCVLCFGRLLDDLQLYRRAKGHHACRIVFEVHHTIGIHDRCADGILRLIATGRKEHIRRVHAKFLRYIVCLCLPRFVPQDTELAGRIIVDEIDVDIA